MAQSYYCQTCGLTKNISETKVIYIGGDEVRLCLTCKQEVKLSSNTPSGKVVFEQVNGTTVGKIITSGGGGTASTPSNAHPVGITSTGGLVYNGQPPTTSAGTVNIAPLTQPITSGFFKSPGPNPILTSQSFGKIYTHPSSPVRMMPMLIGIDFHHSFGLWAEYKVGMQWYKLTIAQYTGYKISSIDPSGTGIDLAMSLSEVSLGKHRCSLLLDGATHILSMNGCTIMRYINASASTAGWVFGGIQFNTSLDDPFLVDIS